MRNILVTGGAGFIGSNFVRYMLKTNPTVLITNYDALTYAGNTDNLRGLPDPIRHTLVHGDIRDGKLLSNILRLNQIDTIVHFAAESHVDRSIVSPDAFIQTNVVGTYSLLEAVRKYWKGKWEYKRFHHISTDEVYGTLSSSESPWNENRPYTPNSPYSASKAASDHLVRAYGKTYGLPITISNCTNNYGPYQHPEKLIPLTILNAMEGRVIPVYGDGQQVRDWVYVEDHCEAIYTILMKGKIGETYHIGGGNQPTNIAIVETICHALNQEFPHSLNNPHEQFIAHISDRLGHDRRYALDCGKIERELGWKPKMSWICGIVKTVKWYIDNQQWVDRVKKKKTYTDWIKEQYENNSIR